MPTNLENSALAPGPEKVNFILIPEKGNAKECSNYCTIALISHTSNVQNSPSQASTVCEPRIPDVQAGFSKGRETRDQITNILHIIEKAREFQKKTSTSAVLTALKPLLHGSKQTGKFYKR